MTREEIRKYVEQDVIQAVDHIRRFRNIDLSDALELLNRARGRNRTFARSLHQSEVSNA